MTDHPEKTVLELSRDHISQLKEMRHDAENNIKHLAEIWLELDEKIKNKMVTGKVEELNAQQNAFHDSLEALISDYEMECNRLENEAG